MRARGLGRVERALDVEDGDLEFPRHDGLCVPGRDVAGGGDADEALHRRKARRLAARVLPGE